MTPMRYSSAIREWLLHPQTEDIAFLPGPAVLDPQAQQHRVTPQDSQEKGELLVLN